MKNIFTLLQYDLKQIRRDSMLILLVLVPLIMVVVIRALIPLIEPTLATYNLQIQDYMPLIFSYFFLTLCPSLFGLASALLLLDDLDDQILLMIRVTPLQYPAYLWYRIAFFTMIPSFLYILLTSVLMNYPIPHWPGFIVTAATASLFGPMFTLLILSLARNKIEGIAMMKATGIFLIAPVAAYFITSWHRNLFYILPTYAPLKTFWALSEGNFDSWGILLGILILLLWISALWKLASRKLLNLSI